MWITGLVEDLDGMGCVGEILARVSGFTSNLHIEGLIGGALRDDHTGLKGIIEDDAIPDLPDRTIELVGSTEARLFLYGEDDDQRRVGELLLYHTLQNFQNDHDPGCIIRAEIRCAVAIEDSIAQDGAMSQPWRHTIHVGVEHQWPSLAGQGCDEVALLIDSGGHPKPGQLLLQIVAHEFFMARCAGDANNFNQGVREPFAVHGFAHLLSGFSNELFSDLLLMSLAQIISSPFRMWAWILHGPSCGKIIDQRLFFLHSTTNVNKIRGAPYVTLLRIRIWCFNSPTDVYSLVKQGGVAFA